MMLAFCLVNLVLFQPQLPLPQQLPPPLLLPQQQLQQPQDQQLDIGDQ